MFGYELADILLFDLETLKESYAGYIASFKWVFYLGLVTNLFLVFCIKINLRVVYALLALCWVFPGYFFFIRDFEAIFWPSAYFGYLAIAMGLLLMYSALRGLNAQTTPHQLSLSKMQLTFTGASLMPVVITYFFSPESVLALGTSATVAALATMSLYLRQKGWLARTLSAFSVLWCLVVAIAVWALIYKV